MVGPLRGGKEDKIPLTTKQKNTFFLWLKKKSHETQEKLIMVYLTHIFVFKVHVQRILNTVPEAGS